MLGDRRDIFFQLNKRGIVYREGVVHLVIGSVHGNGIKLNMDDLGK
jgi:hypothetical protein